MLLYHATSKSNLESIKKHGINGDHTKVRPGVIHLTCDLHTAYGYHQHWEDNDTLIFAIDTSNLDNKLLGPDREDLMEILISNDDGRDWDEIEWEESLLLSGNCTYEGFIPFELCKLKATILNEQQKDIYIQNEPEIINKTKTFEM